MALKDEIKSHIVKAGWTMTDVVKAINEKNGRDVTTQNLSNKLKRETIKFTEVEEIADVIGFSIEWVPKKLDNNA